MWHPRFAVDLSTIYSVVYIGQPRWRLTAFFFISQILRNSTSLAAILGKGIEIHKIRANRDKPGLKAQHMTGIQLVASLYNAKLAGDSVRASLVE